jgi:hypothetical protein
VLGNFTVETFRPHLGERFRLDSEPAMDVELIEAEGVGERPFEASGRVPFSLVFRGPLEPVLPQRIYRFENESLGEFELFRRPDRPGRGRDALPGGFYLARRTR